MSGPLYVPALPARWNAVAAYKDLTPFIQNAVVPLWTLPPRTAATSALLGKNLGDDIRRVLRAHRYRPGWIDAPFVSETDLELLAELLARAWRYTPMRPVTGPERSPARQLLAVDAARHGGNGLGIRVRVPGEWDADAVIGVRSLLRRVGPAVPVDLFVDFGKVLGDRPGAGEEALRALDSLVPLARWRTAAVLAGGYPETLGDLWERGRVEINRPDWEVWREVRNSHRTYLPSLRYGDYGALPARATNVEHKGGGPPVWGVLRYTTDRSFLLVRFRASGPDRESGIRAGARWLTEAGAYRGPAASVGDSWLHRCAHGAGTTGTGSAREWNRHGNSQHLTYVVRCLGREM